MDVGTFPLESVAKLPNITVAFPGEHWSDGKATEVIVPGEAVMPLSNGGRRGWRRALDADLGDPRLAIAKRVVEHPDVNTGPSALGPNEIVNRAIQVGEYVHVYMSGAFHLTLCEARAWLPGELVGWDADAARPTGKGGLGAWVLANAVAGRPTAVQALFEVHEFRKVNASNEGILTVRSLRGQF